MSRKKSWKLLQSCYPYLQDKKASTKLARNVLDYGPPFFPKVSCDAQTSIKQQYLAVYGAGFCPLEHRPSPLEAEQNRIFYSPRQRHKLYRIRDLKSTVVIYGMPLTVLQPCCFDGCLRACAGCARTRPHRPQRPLYSDDKSGSLVPLHGPSVFFCIATAPMRRSRLVPVRGS